jgi:hypothetical protein
VTLDNREYLLTFNWNTRDEGWYLTIYDTLGEALLASARLVLGFDLLKYRANPRLPSGSLVPITLIQQVGEIVYDSFSSGQVSLVYVSGLEYATIQS